MAVQSGNRVELAVGHLACGLAGATFVPLFDAWRETELRHILAVSATVVAIVPESRPGHDYLGAVQALRLSCRRFASPPRQTAGVTSMSRPSWPPRPASARNRWRSREP